jgi:predicted dehydrogenase
VTANEAAAIVHASRHENVPVLVGHHRRHNPIVQESHRLIRKGIIGDVRTAQVTCWFYKPDDYFDGAPWRKQKGAGPISVNLVHDVDLMRHFCGEIVRVQAQASPSARGYDNEDVATAIVCFENGALGTITVSDSVVAPWSWELTSGEYPVYPKTSQSCYLLGGSDGSLSLPDMTVWQHNGEKSWWNPMAATVAPRPAADPLGQQIDHFVDVIQSAAEPLVSAEEGWRTLQVIEAIQIAAATQQTISLDPSNKAQIA